MGVPLCPIGSHRKLRAGIAGGLIVAYAACCRKNDMKSDNRQIASHSRDGISPSRLTQFHNLVFFSNQFGLLKYPPPANDKEQESAAG
jgi:hypothetical protein